MSADNDILTADDLTDEFMTADDGPMPDPNEEYDEPDKNFVDKQYRPPRARQYQNRARKVLNAVMRTAAQHESTVPDAAAIIMYGPQFCEKLGDLANHDAKVRRAVDFITDGTENPYIAFAVAALPLVAQTYRNHQDSLSPKAVVESVKASRKAGKEKPGRKFRIPFTKREITIRFRLSFPSVENFSNKPDALTAYVFGNPEIAKAMEKAGIEVAYPNGNASTKSRV